MLGGESCEEARNWRRREAGKGSKVGACEERKIWRELHQFFEERVNEG